jgi:uncharacterized protein with LGFP repeats
VPRGRAPASNAVRSATRRATSDETGSGSHRRSNFEHGFIDWTPQRGAQVHGPVKFDDGAELQPADG